MKFGVAILLLAVALSSFAQTSKRVVCEKRTLFKVKSVVAWSPVARVPSFFYTADLAVDADGAFKAYHPDDRPGLDALAHAGHPGNWWAVVTDNEERSGRPVLQRQSDPAPGYYVSTTALYDRKKQNPRDPSRYVDAMKIPYIVLPPQALKHARLGDFATVVNLDNGRISGAIVADESLEFPDRIGEGSIALAQALNIDPDPRYGGKDDGGVVYLVYPGSGNGSPRALKDVIANSQRLFEQWGGLDKLHGCLAIPSGKGSSHGRLARSQGSSTSLLSESPSSSASCQASHSVPKRLTATGTSSPSCK